MGIFRRALGFLRAESGLVYVSLGNFSSAVLGALFWLVLAWILRVDQYGEVNYCIALASVAASLSLFGLNTTATVYLAQGDEEVLWEAYSAASVLSLSAAVAVAFFNPFSSLILLSSVSSGMSYAEILGRRMYREYGAVCVLNRVTQIAVSIPLYFAFGLNGILAGYVLGPLAVSYRFFRALKRFRLKAARLREALKFTLHNYGLNLTSTLSGYLDKIVIGSILGFEVLGLYQLGYQFLMFLSIIPGSLYTYMLPEESSGGSSGRVELLGLTSSIAVGALFFGVTPWLIQVFFQRFQEATTPVRVMCLAVIPATLASMCNAKLLGKRKSKPVLLGSLMYLSCLMAGFATLGPTLKELGLSISVVEAQTASAIYLWRSLKTLDLEAKNASKNTPQ